MRMLWFTILLVSPLFGQLQSGSLTVTATRSTVVAPNLVQFTASVATGIDATQDDVLAMMAPAGITVGSLTGVSGTASRLTWGFAWLVPLPSLQDAIAALQALRVQFSVTGMRVSDDLLAATACPAADLLADARAQARKMAEAIRAGLGPVLTVSNPAAMSPAGVTLAGQFGFFIGVLAGIPEVPALSPSTLRNCSLTVTFGLNP
jgi:hypothetical protein